MVTKNLIVKGSELGWVVIAKPPEPIGPFGQKQRFRALIALLFDCSADVGQHLPGASLLGVADPGREDRVDPRAGVESVESFGFRGFTDRSESRRHKFRTRIIESLEKFAQEAAPALREVEPRVLAVQCDHDRRFLRLFARDGRESLCKRLSGFTLVLPPSVLETDGVRQPAVAEEENRTVISKTPLPVKFARRFFAVSEWSIEAALEDPFVGDQPPHPSRAVGCDGVRGN